MIQQGIFQALHRLGAETLSRLREFLAKLEKTRHSSILMKLALTLLAGIVFASAGLTGCCSKAKKSCPVADGKATTACCKKK